MREVVKIENKPDFIKDFYENKYNEDGRMQRQPLEFYRCKEIISRYLSRENMEIGDIGGATGVFSYWLTGLGHRVHLLDYTPLHIEQAKEKGVETGVSLASYTLGDARKTPYNDGQFDIVLEMGPLYHLQGENDRAACLSEAMRILKPGGTLICEVISKYANIFEGFQHNLIEDQRFIKILDENLDTGNHNPGDTGYFTTAYFHGPEEIKGELAQAGFSHIALIPVEGFGSILNVDECFESERKRDLLLKYIRKTECSPELLGVSNHIIAVGRKS